jgi:hypothetical protein
MRYTKPTALGFNRNRLPSAVTIATAAIAAIQVAVRRAVVVRASSSETQIGGDWIKEV